MEKVRDYPFRNVQFKIRLPHGNSISHTIKLNKYLTTLDLANFDIFRHPNLCLTHLRIERKSIE